MLTLDSLRLTLNSPFELTRDEVDADALTATGELIAVRVWRTEPSAHQATTLPW
jgi:hypothetical protein